MPCARAALSGKNPLPLVVLLATLVGCAPAGYRRQQEDNERLTVPEAGQGALYTEAVRGLIEGQQYYAALAHIEEDRKSHGDSAELRLLEADARRNLGQAKAAHALYSSLLNSRWAGDAEHGLGRLYVGFDPAAVLRHLQAAARLKPTDVDIRNDLGYAYLQSGMLKQARIELATAAELAPGDAKSRNNLLLLLMLQNDEAAVRRIAEQAGLDEILLARLRVQAQSLRMAASP